MKSICSILFVAIAVLSCGKKEQEQRNEPVNRGNQVQSREKTYYINNTSNVAIGFVSIGETMTVKAGDENFKRICKEDKCKYRMANGQNKYEIKFKDDAFKLRTESGVLLWKVKIQDDKIKLADNEEMTDVIEIKGKNNSAKISRSDLDLGNIDFGSSELPVIVNGVSEKVMIIGPTKEIASGILVLSEIPMDQRIILFSEAINFK